MDPGLKRSEPAEPLRLADEPGTAAAYPAESPAADRQDAPTEDSLQAYCLFCRTGAEHLAIQSIQQNFPDLIALAPLKSLPEKRKGEWSIRDRIMLPGYIFVYAKGELPFDLRRKTNHVYKILQYERGIRTLARSDAEYAKWILNHQGLIKPSRIHQVGDTIQVIDGPLLDFNGRIVKLDRHKRRVWVAIDFDGQTKTISIGAEYLTSPKPQDDAN